ncbi:MAG: DUF192 domain-containing protein [Candidatus Micrarchaeota archaeon]|nr:DUF192 domain-containing protein [Candidatus Micrarchaeota archaeon]
MNEYLVIAIIIIILVLLIVSQLKTDKRKLTFINKDGSETSISVELSDNTVKQMRGLMFRNSLPQDEGMLFVFPDERTRSFWMMNTTIPLDAIHIDSTGKVVDIIEMQPCKSLNCPSYPARKPAKYVIEVNQGFSKLHNITLNNTFIKIS